MLLTIVINFAPGMTKKYLEHVQSAKIKKNLPDFIFLFPTE